MSRPAIDRARLAEVMRIGFDEGSHAADEGRYCPMEAVAYIAREPWSDAPECACPVISEFIRQWNDSLDKGERTKLLRDLIPQLIGTRANARIERLRSLMAGDWLIRTHAPAWLRRAGLRSAAEQLQALPRIVGLNQSPGIGLATYAAQKAAAQALNITRAWTNNVAKTPAPDGARNDRRTRIWEIVQDQHWGTSRSAALDAAQTATPTIVWTIASNAAKCATRIAAWNAAEHNTWLDLRDTRDCLQQSALGLVHRMIGLRAPAEAGQRR